MLIKYSDIRSEISTQEKVSINEPEICPICKHAIKPVKLFGWLYKDNVSNRHLTITYYCNHCYNSFIAQFDKPNPATENNYLIFQNQPNLAPKIFERLEFDKYINEISPDFVNIYNQALEAEYHQLTEISGIGYRKALEFLIKDFLINHENKDAEKVKSAALGNCINTMIENPQLKLVASRATWLGNDQTHYEHKYHDKDVFDLKKLIDLTVHWISMIHLTDEALTIEKK